MSSLGRKVECWCLGRVAKKGPFSRPCLLRGGRVDFASVDEIQSFLEKGECVLPCLHINTLYGKWRALKQCSIFLKFFKLQ